MYIPNQTNRPQAKLNEITARLVAAVDSLCNCGFSASRVTKAGFSCSGNMNNVLFRAQISETNHNELYYLSQWVTNRDTTLIVAGTRLSLDMECPVYIRSFKDDPCSTSQLGNATQAYPTPQTAGRVPIITCATISQPKPTECMDGCSNDAGITLVVLGSLIVIIGAALIVYGCAKSKKNQ